MMAIIEPYSVVKGSSNLDKYLWLFWLFFGMFIGVFASLMIYMSVNI